MTTFDIKTFEFAPGMSLRTTVKDGLPWFIAKDVCDALGYVNGPDAIARHVDDDERNSIAFHDGIRGNPVRAVINESGLYSLILSSNKPEAKAFRKWVTGTVLPSLRKDGLYVTGQEKPITDDMTLPDLLAQLGDIQAKVDALKAVKVLEWSRHQEEKDARRTALNFFKGGRRKPARRLK